MNLARHLRQVREAIQTLPTDEELQMENATTPATETTKAVKKVTKKKTGAKKVVKTAAPASNQVTLSEIAKSVKMEPRRARRILRGCDLKAIEVDGARWTWTKGSNAHKKVVEVLKTADSDK